MSHAFPLACRLTEKGCFSKVFEQPLFTRRTHNFTIFAARSGVGQARLGIVVAKRNVKLAVNRNKLKRQIRESFRLQQHTLSGLDVVVVVKRDFMLSQAPVPKFFKEVSEKLAQLS